ncbi:hypothetical protein BCR34DRAFT_240011 [Clohesyomyces aquaticus]|uniref:Uncharacterized protein n=1 Tax=Clohesyomyces aquaticus TaxID=1231657 RepID=A0A1Y1Y5M1_9PLEO|nr:hypothetical protein BCR34DRAFT_240011 [Clohesyomyces aquaticus]
MDSTTMDPQAHLALTANKLALSAIIISIAAFVVTFLQLLLGNIVSKEARWKVGSGAIGIITRHKSFRVTPWGIRVLYPEVSFSIDTFLGAVSDSRRQGLEFSFLQNVAIKKKARWCPVTSEMVISADVLSDGVRVLVGDNGRPLTSGILTWQELVRYMWWKCTHTVLPYERPRATWAQIIRAFGIFDGESLVLRKLNTNTIPSTIDAPIQRVKLWDLGCLSLLMGCTDVSVNIQSRQFHAEGMYCTLSTEDLPMFGQAVKFEGDIHSINGQLAQCDGASLRGGIYYVRGSFLLTLFSGHWLWDDRPFRVEVGIFEGEARTLKRLAFHLSKLEPDGDNKRATADGNPTYLPLDLLDTIFGYSQQRPADPNLQKSLRVRVPIIPARSIF